MSARFVCALLALLPMAREAAGAPRPSDIAACPYSTPLFTSSFFECPDRSGGAAFAYALGDPADVNSGATDILCEAFDGVACYGATGTTGDDITDIEGDWASPGMVGCPFDPVAGSPLRIVIVTVGSDGSGVVVSLSGLSPEFGYSLDAAQPVAPDGLTILPLYCDARSARPALLGADAGILTLQFAAPRVASDCDPGSTGQFAWRTGLTSDDPCGDRFAASPGLGGVYTSLQPCGAVPDIRKSAWTPTGVVPDGTGMASIPYLLPADPATCLYVGGTVDIAGQESAAITGFVRVGPPPIDAPPTASVIASPAVGIPPLVVKADASASIDGDQSPIVQYTFDFGDGAPLTRQSSPVASHTFGRHGDYVITVRVTDAAGLSATADTRVDVVVPSESAPAAVLAATPSSGSAPLTVTLDASRSTDPDLTPIASYLFDFGDGSPITGPQSAASAQHTYRIPGVYAARLTVTDTAGLSATAGAQVTVTPPSELAPSPALRVSPSIGSPPLVVTADASQSLDFDATPIATYQFDFGDGTAPLAPQASPFAQHVYDSTGTFEARVTVTDTAGLSASATAMVTVVEGSPPDSPPVPALQVTPASGSAPLVVLADASASTDADTTPIEGYVFNFGDGTPAIAAPGGKAEHLYAAPGIYTLTVTVADGAGLTAGAASTVTVSEGLNWVGNPGFEYTLSGWKPSGAGVTLGQVNGGRSGYLAARLVNTNPGPAGCGLNDSPNWVSQTSPGVYVGRLWARADTAGAILRLRFREYAGPALIGSESAAIVLSTDWQEARVAYVPKDPGLSTLDLQASVSNAAPGACFDADDVSISFGWPLAGDAPPAAALEVRPTSGAAPLSVAADASASGDGDLTPIVSYLFDFGDGTAPVGPQSAATAQHTYALPGSYTATLTVVDTYGGARRAAVGVTVGLPQVDAPPKAGLSLSPPSGPAPLGVTADASSSYDGDVSPIASYRFDFGDGSPPAGPQGSPVAAHLYTAAGVYTVTVTVTDQAGLSSTTTAGVQVNLPGELAANGGFEVDLSGWKAAGTNVTLTRVSGGHSGGYAARITNGGTTPVTGTLNDSPNWVARTATGIYLAGLWVRSDTPGATLTLRLREYTGSTLVGTVISTVVLTGTWQPVTIVYVPANPGISTLDFNAFVGGLPGGASFDADDVSITLH